MEHHSHGGQLTASVRPDGMTHAIPAPTYGGPLSPGYFTVSPTATFDPALAPAIARLAASIEAIAPALAALASSSTPTASSDG